MLSSKTATQKMLIFSLAMNGYQLVYRSCLSSQARYASKIGADYCAVTRPFFSYAGVECCWLKLHLAKLAFRLGYQQILFLDADAQVQASAPDIRTNLAPGKSIYLAPSYSGQLNSGVMLLCNSVATEAFLDNVLNTMTQPLLGEDSVGWGENGYIIQALQNCAAVEHLCQRWNNTSEANMSDYIRHFNHGPLRGWLLRYAWHKSLSRGSNLYYKYLSKLTGLTKPQLIKRLVLKDLAMICSGNTLFGADANGQVTTISGLYKNSNKVKSAAHQKLFNFLKKA